MKAIHLIIGCLLIGAVLLNSCSEDSTECIVAGESCDDNNPNTLNDVFDINCICRGVAPTANTTFVADVAGRIVDPDGQPIPNVNVYVGIDEAITNSNGVYWFYDVTVRVGGENVHASHPNYHPEKVRFVPEPLLNVVSFRMLNAEEVRVEEN